MINPHFSQAHLQQLPLSLVELQKKGFDLIFSLKENVVENFSRSNLKKKKTALL